MTKLRLGESKPVLVPWDAFPVLEEESNLAMARYATVRTVKFNFYDIDIRRNGSPRASAVT